MVKFSDLVMVLGSEYKIKVSDKKKDKSLDDCDGYCKVSENIIGVRDLHDDDDWKSESESHIRSRMKKILRHEIVHARCEVDHEEVESNRNPGKMLKFVRLGDKESADGFDEEPAAHAPAKKEKAAEKPATTAKSGGKKPFDLNSILG